MSLGLDTSVVLRLLVGEPAPQYQAATRLVQETTNAGESIHVSDLVLAEAYFALQSYYQLTKAEAIDALSLFCSHSGLSFSATTRTVLAIPRLSVAKPGMVDRLIHGQYIADGHSMVTFEKASGKLQRSRVLTS